jgi:hypothetical protein
VARCALPSAGGVDLLQSLQLLMATCGMSSALRRFGLSLDAAELAGTQNVAGVRESSSDADRAGLRVHLAIDKAMCPFCG